MTTQERVGWADLVLRMDSSYEQAARTGLRNYQWTDLQQIRTLAVQMAREILEQGEEVELAGERAEAAAEEETVVGM